MGVHISRVQINNFRNFHKLDVQLGEKAVIVGENNSGKTNFVYALRLILDPNLPDTARQLKEEDFWDGIESPIENGAEIEICIDLKGFEDNEKLLAILTDYFIDGGESSTARLTYKYAPLPALGHQNGDEDNTHYDFVVYGGDDQTNTYGYQQRKWMPLQVLPALRDAETDLDNWRRSPLRPLIDRLNINKDDLEQAANKVDEATEEILKIENMRRLSIDIENRLKGMIGVYHGISPSLGFASTKAIKLLRSLRLFVDGDVKRAIGDTSLGICNIIYLTLLILDLEFKEASGERASTILAIEEPEAHIHPHLQRLVYGDFLNRSSSMILTTHSPHIVSVSPIRSLVALTRVGTVKESKASSTLQAELTEQQLQDLERYINATRGEILFARGVILAEGDAETYLIPALLNTPEFTLDKWGVTVCSVQGTDFAPYVQLLGKKSMNIPFVVVTDGDPFEKDGSVNSLGLVRGKKLLSLILDEGEISGAQEKLEGKNIEEQAEVLCEYGIFIGKNTLEIDLVKARYQTEMIEAIRELGAGPRRIEKFSNAITGGELSKEDTSEILRIIEAYGKGRFSQRLAQKVTSDRCPPYIQKANECLKSMLEQ